jgi:hypothetical protein
VSFVLRRTDVHVISVLVATVAGAEGSMEEDKF